MKLRNLTPEKRIEYWMNYRWNNDKIPRKLKKHIFGKRKVSQKKMQKLSDELEERR